MTGESARSALAALNVSIIPGGHAVVSGENAAQIVRAAFPGVRIARNAAGGYVVGKTRSAEVADAISRAKAQNATAATEPEPRRARTRQELEAAGLARREEPMMRRNDLVGAVLRVTGGEGLSPKIAPDVAGDRANHAGGLRGLFRRGGTEDLSLIAEYLETEEGFNLGEGDATDKANRLAEMLRDMADGREVHRSMEATYEEAQRQAEKEYRQNVRRQAEKLNRNLPDGAKIKTRGVSWEALEAAVDRENERRRENVLVRWRRRIERQGERAKQAYYAMLEWARSVLPESEFEALVEEQLMRIPMDNAVDYYRRGARLIEERTLAYINGELENAAREDLERFEERFEPIFDDEGGADETRPRDLHEAIEGRTEGGSANGGRREDGRAHQGDEGARRGGREDFGLTGETEAEIRAREEAKRRADEEEA
ncbi:MAG: hypothetical protein LBS70_07230, partial [Candidatus Accumulibacter sp.]|nr:hypothetical protein [Accumulibacter sp.]